MDAELRKLRQTGHASVRQLMEMEKSIPVDNTPNIEQVPAAVVVDTVDDIEVGDAPEDSNVEVDDVSILDKLLGSLEILDTPTDSKPEVVAAVVPPPPHTHADDHAPPSIKEISDVIGTLPAFKYFDQDQTDELKTTLTTILNTLFIKVRNEIEPLGEKVISLTEERNKRKLSDINSTILGKIPNFQTYIKSRQYSEFANEFIPNSRVRWGESIAQAYNDGDTEYVITALTEFENTMKNKIRGKLPAADMATGKSAPVTAGKSGNTTTKPPVYKTLSELNAAYRRKDIGRAEFTKLLNTMKQG